MKTNERILEELAHLRREVGNLRGEIANRRCRGGTPAPSYPWPPSYPPSPPPSYPWDWPRVTWFRNSNKTVPVL